MQRRATEALWSERRLWAVVLLATLFAVLVAYSLLLRQPVDTDSFWHVKTGEYIVSHHAIPSTDVFSWYGEQAGLEWMPHEWLFDVGLYGVYAAGGFRLVYALTALVFGGIVLLVFLLTYERTGHQLLSLLVALAVVPVLAKALSPRPHIVTFLLLVLAALFLQKGRWLLALPVMLVGVNMHGAMYPLYLFVFALYTVPENLPAFGLACLTSLLTPFAFRLLPYPFFGFDRQVLDFQEYQPTALIQKPVLLAALLGVALTLRRDRVPAKEALAALALTLLALVAVRHVHFFFILALPILAPYLRLSSDNDDGADGPPPAPSSGAGPPGDARRPRAFVVLDAFLLTSLACGLIIVGWRSAVTPLDVDKDFPKGAVRYILSNGITHIWNDWGDGGYLIFNGVPSFVDGRADPFSPFFDKGVTLASEYADVWKLRADIRPFIRKYGIEYLLVGRDIPLYRVLEQSADFEAVYSDETDIVFRYAPDH